MEKEIEEKKKNDMIDLSFNGKNNLLQAIISVDVFGKPKCMSRRRRNYGAKSINR